MLTPADEDLDDPSDEKTMPDVQLLELGAQAAEPTPRRRLRDELRAAAAQSPRPVPAIRADDKDTASITTRLDAGQPGPARPTTAEKLVDTLGVDRLAPTGELDDPPPRSAWTTLVAVLAVLGLLAAGAWLFFAAPW